IVADEAHHLMPEPWSGAPLGTPRAVESMLLITVHPGQVAAPVLAAVEGVVERIRTIPSHSERRRHVRKYSAGDLTEEQSFYFRGPEGKLKIRAQNLALFLQLGEGVDEETWLHHFRLGEYSAWFRRRIKD